MAFFINCLSGSLLLFLVSKSEHNQPSPEHYKPLEKDYRQFVLNMLKKIRYTMLS